MFAAKNELFSPSQGYQISRSVRLRSSASAYFNRTPASASDQKKWTFSAWVKRGQLGTTQIIAQAGTSGTTFTYIAYFNSSDQLVILDSTVSGVSSARTSAAVFRDPSAWYHIVVNLDAANSVCNGYVNGVAQTFTGTQPSNQNWAVNSAIEHRIGRAWATNTSYFDGYLTEINFIDGQALTPSSFGENDTVTGVWKPKKYAGTYGTNGFYLNFSDNSNNTATTIGKDYSGNGNNWTPNNISVTSGVTYDSMIDVPTMWADGGNGRGNYCVVNPLDKGSLVTISDGNLRITGNSASNSAVARSTMGVSTGKWYWETTITTVGGISYAGMAIEPAQDNAEQYWIASGFTKGCGRRNSGGALYTGYGGYGAVSGITAASFTTGDVIGVAVDFDNGALYYSKNGVFENSGVPTSGSSKTGAFNVWTAGAITGFPGGGGYNGSVNDLNMGQRPFTYIPPSGFKALNTQNLPAPTISNGALYMAATTYTGTGASNTISNGNNNTIGATFKPDWVWIKSRSAATSHELTDSVRGVTKSLNSNTTAAEATDTNGLTAFGSTGFTVGTDTNYNNNTATYVAWQWQAGAGTTSSNTSGSITSTVSVNATAGFSVVSFNSGTAGNKTVGHGLGVAPSLIITKNRDGVASLAVWSSSFSNTAQGYLLLNGTGAVTNDSRQWANTAPTSTVFSFESGYTFTASNNIIAYCFSAVRGYSAFGSYTGNGSTDGPFVFLGFRPRWVMIKRTDTAGNNWVILDTSRDTYNASGLYLYPNLSAAEDDYRASTGPMDILSNGFKQRSSLSNVNASGATYIYACFAENPFKLALAR